MSYRIDPSIYLREIGAESPVPVEQVETEIDLYWRIALEIYSAVREQNERNEPARFILPVGPTFQYRRFAELCRRMPLDLSRLHCFFMDEYLEPGEENRAVPVASPLSFRGFIEREFLGTVPADCGLEADQIYFPDPADPAAYDRKIEELGGIDICFAGVGINGHLAFNEAPAAADAPSRVVELTRETITINSNTAMRGAYDQVPAKAVTVGMKQILASRELKIYMNRPWQAAVVRKLLFGPIGPEFPASFARRHPKANLTVTPIVAMKPDFALR